MDLVFANNRIEQTCASIGTLRSRLGDRGARSAAAQLASLRAASSLAELRHLPGRCSERGGHIALRLAGGGVLLFEATGEPQPASSDGGLDWRAILAIRVLDVLPDDTQKKG
jgi:hypothetical protein